MIGEKLRGLLILEFSMIQRSRVPSLLSFWDEHFLHSWFDTESASVSSVVAADLASGALHCREIRASDAVVVWSNAETGMTSTNRHAPPADLGSS
jgi:hypothetical protein